MNLLCLFGFHDNVPFMRPAWKPGKDNASILTIHHDARTMMADGFVCNDCGRRSEAGGPYLPPGWRWVGP